MKTSIFKTGILLFFISLGYTLGINALNVYYIKLQNPSNRESNAQSLVYGSTVYSIDNYWYVNQVKNYIQSGRFTVDTSKVKYEVRRTPVYPLFYGAHYWLFGEEKSYFYIRFTQAILLAIATVFLFLAVYNFTSNTVIGIIAALLYTLQPAISIATQYTYTEAISSEIVCLIFWVLSLIRLKNKGYHYFWLGFLFSLAILCRPAIFFLFPALFIVFLYNSNWSLRKLINIGIFFGIGSSLLFLPWIIRNYVVTKGEVILLEKFYGDPMDYGLPNIQLREWIACWTNPADFSSEQISNSMMHNISRNEPVEEEKFVDSLIKVIPSKVYNINKPEKVKSAYYNLYEFYKHKHLYGVNESIKPIETKAIISFSKLKYQYIRNNSIGYYIITPLLFIKSIVFQSNSATVRFLDNYESNYLKIGIKFLLYLINVLCFISLFIALFFFKRYNQIYSITILYVSITFFILICYVKYFEARYLFPLFPFLYALLAICIVEVWKSLKKRLNL